MRWNSDHDRQPAPLALRFLVLMVVHKLIRLGRRVKTLIVPWKGVCQRLPSEILHQIWARKQHQSFHSIELQGHPALVSRHPSLRVSVTGGQLKCKYGAGTQSWPTLCHPMGCSPPGSSVHGSLQARIQERVAISSSRGSSQPRD